MNRPVLKLTSSRFDNIIDRLALLMLLITIGIVIYSVYNLPAIIPIHFSGNGVPDNYGSKETLLFLPALAIVIYLFLNYLKKQPHWFNYPVTITAENAPLQYAAAVRMMRLLNCCIMMIFLTIAVCSYLVGAGKLTRLPAYLIPLLILLAIAPTIFYLIGTFKK
jgi:uncharacterized membrane protein